METKKSLRANLEKGKSISFMMGAVVALAVLFTGFEWGAIDIKIDTNNKFNPFPDEVIEVLITRQEPPEPPKPEILKSPDVIVLVDDKTVVDPIKITPSDDFADKRQPEVYKSTIEARKEEPVEEKIYIAVEVMPSFPGGDKSLFKWLAENINYPVIAAENGIDGLVACSFIVNADGSISDVNVIRSIDPLLDKEAVRVLELMPKWNPGVQQGKNVRVKYTVPVRFRLRK